MQRITLGNEKVFLFSALINKLTLTAIANMMSQLHSCLARYTLHAITQTQLKEELNSQSWFAGLIQFKLVYLVSLHGQAGLASLTSCQVPKTTLKPTKQTILGWFNKCLAGWTTHYKCAVSLCMHIVQSCISLAVKISRG